MHGMVPDALDPRFIDFTPPRRYIYHYRDDDIRALVDEEDWGWFSQWRWKEGISRRGKIYLRRSTKLRDGGRVTNRSLYLHIEVMKRTGLLPPSPDHVIVDHRNGYSLDCRRANLRWATRTMNARNVAGALPFELWEKMNSSIWEHHT